MANAGIRLIHDNGIAYIHDCIRVKLISTSRIYLRGGVKSRKASNQYLRVEDKQPTLSVGDSLPRPGTITSLTANCEVASTWILEVRRKGSVAVLASLAINASDRAEDTSLDIDVNQGDVIQLFMNGVNISFPRGLLEIAWRL